MQQGIMTCWQDTYTAQRARGTSFLFRSRLTRVIFLDLVSNSPRAIA